ncbi:uncharacterized protein MONOS_15255 [Monocercomonoides exilis]|uniref:uncharacterized protein n=1 Tax=Monocercomonoides exilis TaxID=2049356 RepID=UPI00355A644F|nr:hypothetical protein MONOS_15255 [Monocercomonoides exilis]|eukprot:MONOS_15255.1-p1 / transcript=MONOS_15255.1 / gene=MONOS_15255 / organism=Monocercomonoides_exilis_PA203 / gene_product=unspecified product / transcript_product=unspecified product / location=Mono_scaffold01179:8547-9860(-) / protein_length=285 / sequence_SO=supercontig / SO=protein_coding / is_pseudo=false
MSSCSFSSVCDAYDGGIVPSLNSPSSSLAASNTSFTRCIRSQNVAVSGTEGNPSKPGRQQIADNGANSFTWCVWNGSKANGTSTSTSNGTSNGGAIYMYNLASGTLSVRFCSFNDCYAYYAGGGILCRSAAVNFRIAKQIEWEEDFISKIFRFLKLPVLEQKVGTGRALSGGWQYQHTEKKDWVKEGIKDRYVGVGGNDTNNLCGMSEAAPCKTVGRAVGSSMAQLSWTITVLSGRHVSEGTTISVGEKKISIVGRGKTVSVIGTSALSNILTMPQEIHHGMCL